jgi:hypothetical protein
MHLHFSAVTMAFLAATALASSSSTPIPELPYVGFTLTTPPSGFKTVTPSITTTSPHSSTSTTHTSSLRPKSHPTSSHSKTHTSSPTQTSHTTASSRSSASTTQSSKYTPRISVSTPPSPTIPSTETSSWTAHSQTAIRFVSRRIGLEIVW